MPANVSGSLEREEVGISFDVPQAGPRSEVSGSNTLRGGPTC